MTGLFERDGVTAFCGSMPGAALDVHAKPAVILTDPPYSRTGSSTVRTTVAGGHAAARDGDQFWRYWFASVWAHLAYILPPTSCGFVFCDVRTVAALETAVLESNSGWIASQFLVWDRECIGLGSPFRNQYEMIAFVRGPGFKWEGVRDIGTVVRCKWPYGAHEFHQAEKPVPLLMRLLSWLPPGLVLDSFMGSGSTLVASLMAQRRCIGIEQDERLCEVARQRVLHTEARNLV